MDFLDYAYAAKRASERYRRTAAEREGRLSALNSGDWKNVDSPARIARRMMSKGMVSEAGDLVSAGADGRAIGFNPLERIIGDDDIMSSTFLYQGASVARSVGRVVVREPGGKVRHHGTGFMVSPQLLLTNEHVLEDEHDAKPSTVQFDYWEDSKGAVGIVEEYALRPDRFFEADPDLDFALVAVSATNDAGTAVKRRGWSPLIAESGKSLVGEPVTIVQHPRGSTQKIVLPDKDTSKIVNLLEDFLHYDADTRRGSSGSPVFNVDWELAALHHAGVWDTDDDGNVLLKDGTVWDGTDETAHLIKWISNEGVRISRIVAKLKSIASSWTPQEATLFSETTLPRPPFEDIIGIAHADIGPELQSHTPVMNAYSVSRPGAATFTIPIHVSVSLGGDPGTPVDPAPVRNAMDTVGDDEGEILRSGMAAIERNRSRPYYEEDKDHADRDAYYADVMSKVNDGGREFYLALSELLRHTHTKALPYRKAKNEYLYPWIDLHDSEDGRHLIGIYSGKRYESRELIERDLEIDRLRREDVRTMLMQESFVSDEAMAARIEGVRDSRPYNCEHVVVQSWFSHKEPMKGDLHHLFASDQKCNGFRDSNPYWDYADPDSEAAETRARCGAKTGKSRFEPELGKGPAARATLYFLLRHPKKIGDDPSKEMTADRLKYVLDWHAADPPGIYEFHRNAAIREVQGNRNPLIDFPEWASKIDFELGFA